MAGDDVTITIRADSGEAVRAFRDVNGHLRDMRGRFVSEGAAMSGSMNRLSASIAGVRGSIIPLAAAAVPLAAAMAPIAVKAGAAGLAVAAFGAAVAGQASHLTEASEAQEKYNTAVTQYGRGSKQAAEAQRAVQATFAAMPQATARAAIGLQTLKDDFKDWSDSTAEFTMAPVEKSFTVLGQVLPKLTPMVKATSTQLERLVDVAGGAVVSPGFDALSEKVSSFANDALQDAVDGIIHFTRVLSEGETSGPIKTFMEYAEQNGPALRETLGNVGDAVSTLVEAAAEAGPGMLTLVNAAADLVASLPPELVTILMQTAVALKLVTLAGAGVAAAAGGIAAFGARLTALRAASTAAGGGLTGVAAAFGTLGAAAKASIVVAGIAAVVLAFGKLASLGREAPPDVDKLTTSLGQLGRTGKASGEAARLFGDDLDKLYESVRSVSDPSLADDLQQGLVKVFTLGFADSTPVKEAKERLDGIDEALTNLVKGGKSEVAAAAFQRLSDEYVEGGGKLSDFTGEMDSYQSALADVAFEQQLVADSMGIFGQAAQDTQAKLDGQRQSADGLRQSILALNDAHRSAYDAQIGFEASLDSLTESFKEHGATLDIDTEAGRKNGEAMSAAAAAHDEMIASGIAAGESLGSMTSKSDRLRESMLKLATEAFDGNRAKAVEYVNTLLGVPEEIKTLVTAEREDAIAGLQAVQAEIDATPSAHTVTVDTLNASAIAALEAVGLKTRQLPDGRTEVYTANGKAISNIGAVADALSRLNGRTANTYTTHTVTTRYLVQGATGEVRNRERLRPGHYATGGQITGPGTGTSDSIPIMASNGEYVINAASARKHLPLIEAINEDRLPRFARGGSVSKSEREARNDARSDLTVSRFGQFAGNKRSEFRSELIRADSVQDLVNTLNQWRSIIKKATHGGVEKSLLRSLDSAGKKLLAYEKAHDKASTSLQKSKDRLDDLRESASRLRESVQGGVLSAANITKRQGDGPITVASIMGGLTASRDKSTAFAQALKDLQKRGVAGSLIEQIAEAGIEGGGLETAGALLKASGSEINSMNSLQRQITQAAVEAGKTASDAVFGSQIKGQEALVRAWQATTDRLFKSMDKVAASLEKLVEKGFGMKASGGIVGMAASGGIRSNLTWVGERGPELLDLPPGARVWSNPDSKRLQQQAWASMLNTPRGGGGRTAPAPVGAASNRPMLISVSIAGREFGQLWVDTGRREVRALGGLRATLGGED